jgi:hypothetical protein
LWVNSSASGEVCGDDDQIRMLVLPAQGFAGSPLLDVCTPNSIDWQTWADDGSALAWSDREGLKVWRRGADEVVCLLRWLPDATDLASGLRGRADSLWFSPDARHLAIILGAIDTKSARVIVVGIADGAATEIGSGRGAVGIVEWVNEDEVAVGYDFGSCGEGRWGYRHTDHVSLSALPLPWQLPPDVAALCLVPPMTTPVRHRNHDP